MLHTFSSTLPSKCIYVHMYHLPFTVIHRGSRTKEAHTGFVLSLSFAQSRPWYILKFMKNNIFPSLHTRTHTYVYIGALEESWAVRRTIRIQWLPRASRGVVGVACTCVRGREWEGEGQGNMAQLASLAFTYRVARQRCLRQGCHSFVR